MSRPAISISGGGSSEPMADSGRVKKYQSLMYAISAVNVVGQVCIVAFYFVALILYYEKGILAFSYTNLWLGAVASSTAMLCSTLSKPTRGGLLGIAIMDAVGISASVLGLVGVATYFGLTVYPIGECILDVGSLSVVQTLICSSPAKWVSIVLWFMNIPVALQMLANAGVLIADFIYILGVRSVM